VTELLKLHRSLPPVIWQSPWARGRVFPLPAASAARDGGKTSVRVDGGLPVRVVGRMRQPLLLSAPRPLPRTQKAAWSFGPSRAGGTVVGMAPLDAQYHSTGRFPIAPPNPRAPRDVCWGRGLGPLHRNGARLAITNRLVVGPPAAAQKTPSFLLSPLRMNFFRDDRRACLALRSRAILSDGGPAARLDIGGGRSPVRMPGVASETARIRFGIGKNASSRWPAPLPPWPLPSENARPPAKARQGEDHN